MSADAKQPLTPEGIPTAPSRGKKSKPFLLFGFAIRRAPLILLLGATLSFLLSFLILPQVQPIYQTDGQLLIDPSRETTLAGRERNPIPGSLRDYTRTLTNRMLTPDVLLEAVSRLDPEEFPSFLDPAWSAERNAARLGSRIRVREVALTYLISLNISANQPQGLAPVLNLVMQAFIEKTQREQQQRQERRLAYLTLEQDKILERVREIREFTLNPESLAAEQSFLKANYDLQVERVSRLQQAYLAADADVSLAESALHQAIAARTAIIAIDLQPFVDELIFNNHSINLMEHSTYNQLQELRSSIDGLTPTNPERRNVEERMRLITNYLDNHKQRASQEITRQLNEKREYELDLEVVQTRTQLDSMLRHREYLEELLHTAQEAAAEVALKLTQSRDLEFTLEQLRGRLTALNERIDDAEMEANAPVHLSIDKLARAPGGPARTNAQTLLLITLVLGFGSVGSFILVFDFLDNRIRDPSELELGLGAPGPQPIPYLVGAAALPGAFAEATLDVPRHPVMHPLRALAVRMESEHERYGARVFCLAGLGPKCGVTASALNLAHILRTRDRKLLIVECNMLRPGMARTHGGLREHPGVSEVLDGTVADWTATIQTDPRRRIDIMTVGNPGVGIPDRSALITLIAQVRQHYDLILLDCAPILEDEFAQSAALHSDATLLVAREDVSLYRDLRRSLDLLLDAQIPALSAVLNFTRPKRGERIVKTLQKEMLLLSRLHASLHKRLKRILGLLGTRGR